MIGILKFKLPEEQEEFDVAQRGGILLGQLQSFDNYLRDTIKYKNLSDESLQIHQEIRDKLHEIIENIW